MSEAQRWLQGGVGEVFIWKELAAADRIFVGIKRLHVHRATNTDLAYLAHFKKKKKSINSWKDCEIIRLWCVAEILPKQIAEKETDLPATSRLHTMRTAQT